MSPSLKRAALLAPLALLAGSLVHGLAGCHLVADLEDDHELRLSRWPDSPTAACATDMGPIPCPAEGQPFYGQDGSYSFNIPDYREEGAAVHESVTGLDWKRHPAPELTWQEAIDGCAGFGDGYRLPSRLELVSLIDYGRTEAKAGPASLHDLKPDYHWTTSITPSTTSVWVVHLGCGPYPCDMPDTSSPVGAGTTRRTYNGTPSAAICVKGEPLFADPPPPPAAPPDPPLAPAYTDTRTGLVWSHVIHIGTWKEAIFDCETWVENGAEDWRLPNIKELQTIIIETAIEATKFLPFVETEATLWSSTPYVGASGWAYALYSNGGTAFAQKMSTNYYEFFCVRGPYPPPE